MSQRERVLAGLLLALLLGAVLWMAFGYDWSNEGGQYQQLGEQLANRRGGVNQSQYKYVANSRTSQYWPNQQRYVDAIPSGDRVFILDDEALSEFRGYRPGPR
jgi:hypothetical protein